MPFYELMLVLRQMPKKEVVACLKRTADVIWKEDGVIRRVDYLGLNKLPFSSRGLNEGAKVHEGNYFLYHLSIGNQRIGKLRPEFKLDVDILNHYTALSDESKVPDDYQCTLDEELQPPSFRKSVQPLLENKNFRADRR